MDTRSVKSPLPRTPLIRSPKPTSPMLYEKYKSRCAYGLIDLFPFRRRHSKKLIASGRGSNRNAECDADMGSTLDLFPNVDAKFQCTDNGGDKRHSMIDSSNAKAKKIVVENTSFEEQTKKKAITPKPKNTKASSENLPRDRRSGIKASRGPYHFLKYGCYDVATVENREAGHKDLVEGTSGKLIPAATAEAPTYQVHPQNEEHVAHECISCPKHDSTNGVNVQPQMNEAIEAFINQKLIDGKCSAANKSAHQSKHFFDALEILNSNKDLFIKLLQDPNSVLVKHIEDLRDSQLKKQQITSSIEAKEQENTATEVQEYDKSNFGFKNLRSRAKSFSVGDSQSFEQIVVLKPSSRSLQNCEDDLSHVSPEFGYSLKNVQHSVRPSVFPLDGIKRKLTRAIGRSLKEERSMLSEQTGSYCVCNSQDSEECGMVTDMKIVRRTTGCKNPVDIRGMTSSMEVKEEGWSDRLKLFESGGGKEGASASESKVENLNCSNLRLPSGNEDKSSVKDRMRPCKLLSAGNANFLVQKKQKAGDGMIDMPDNDLLPVISPRKSNSQMGFSQYGNLDTGKGTMLRNHRERNDSCLSPLKRSVESPELAHYEEECHDVHILETNPNISDKNLPNMEVHENLSCLENDSRLGGSTKIIETNDCGSLKVNKYSKRSFELESPHRNGSSNVDTDDLYLKAKSSEVPRSDFHMENPMLSSPADEYSSNPLRVWRDENLISNKDMIEHSSPVSVLERFFTDDVSSPSVTESEPVEPSVPPQQSGTAEDRRAKVFQSSLHWRMKSSALSEEHVFVIKYICEVLQASDINWDDLSSSYHEKNQFLDQIQWDKVDVWPSQFGGNPTLLFGFIVEVLEHIYQQHFRCSPWVSFTLPKVCPLHAVESMAQEIMNYIVQGLNWHPPSRTLQQLVEQDLAKSGMWTDIKLVSEEIVAETVESILNELVVEAATE